MSHENYIKSQEISAAPFEAIIMGFMRIADDDNLAFLKGKYPSIWDELQARYNAPGGLLPGEMKKCERCGDQYLEAWDKCPSCKYVRTSKAIPIDRLPTYNPKDCQYPDLTIVASGGTAPPVGVGKEPK